MAAGARARGRSSADGSQPLIRKTQIKVLYSNTGLYFLMEGTDKTLTATMSEDFMNLWNEDVFEVFLWTDERFPCTSSTRSRRWITSCRS